MNRRDSIKTITFAWKVFKIRSLRGKVIKIMTFVWEPYQIYDVTWKSC